jgi:chromate transporter
MPPTRNLLKPATTKDWFLLNLKIGALSFGGGSRILLYQESVVEKNKWISDSEFSEILTLSQIVPGPNLVNLSVYLGFRLSGVISTVLGVLALALPGVFVILFLVSFIDLNDKHVSWIFKGFSIASATVFLQFLWVFSKRLITTEHKSQSRVWTKNSIRVLLAILVALASYLHFPLSQILIASLTTSFLVEWFL